MNVIKLQIKAEDDQLIIRLPEDMRNKSLEVTIERTDKKEKPDVPLIGLLKGKFSSQQIDEYTQKVREEWERNF